MNQPMTKGELMQANPRSIDKLFNGQARYIVPMFQRLYVWDEDPQWKTLWEDVIEKSCFRLDGKKTNPHYLGALIIEGVTPLSGREVTRLLVIDGQQRLTTLQLLLCALRDISRSNGWDKLDRVTTRYLENADEDVMEKPEEEVFKLWPTQLNRDVFSHIIKAGSRKAVEEKYPLIRLPRKRKPEPRSNLVNGYCFFHDQITEWLKIQLKEREGKSSEDCAFCMLDSIKEDFRVVEISLSEGDDSQEIFYSLNSQGRPLSQSDLLRSLIFMRAEKENTDRDRLFADYWSKFETSFWSTETKRGGRSYSRLDLALRHFLAVKKAELVDARRVNEEYRRWIDITPPRYSSVREELEDFSNYAKLYEQCETANGTILKSTDFMRVMRDFDVSTAMPLFLFLKLEAELSFEQLEDCLQIVQSFIVRRAFLNLENKEYNKLFLEVISAINYKRGADVAPALAKKLLRGGGNTRSWPNDEEVRRAALNKHIYREMKLPALKLVLERLEIGLRGKKTESVDVNPNLQIEHVMPQKWWPNWPLNGHEVKDDLANKWLSLTEEEKVLVPAARARSNALHTLGNLTLLNKYANPAAGNKPYIEKRAEYAHSVLRLNRYFDHVEQWDEAAIENRGRELADLFCRIYPRPSGDGS